jgi:hypothetical protein
VRHITFTIEGENLVTNLPGQPSLRDKHIVRLAYVRSRIQTLGDKIRIPETPAVMAEQYLIEMSQLEAEEAFLLRVLKKPPRITPPLSEHSVKSPVD